MSHKILVLTQEEADSYQLSGLKQHNDIKAIFDANTFKWQLFEQFQDGAREDTFGMVIAYLKGMSVDDVEMSEEFYQHYATAPVVAWIITEGEETNWGLKQKLYDMNRQGASKCKNVFVGDENNIKDAFKEAYEFTRKRHETHFKDVVKPVFNTFD